MVLLAVNMPVFASETLLKGSVLYTVESARKLAFEGLALKLDKEKIKPYLIDENNEENRAAIKNNVQPEGRYIMSFSMAKGMVYPFKIGKYNAVTGNLIAIGLYVSEDEQYAYTKNGKLKAHWVGDTGYNAKGKPIAKRSVVNEIPAD